MRLPGRSVDGVWKETLRVQFCDTPGYERFHSLIPRCCSNAQCCIAVFSVCNASTLREAQRHVERFRQCAELGAPVWLVGTKADLAAKRVVPQDEAAALAVELDATYFELWPG